MSFQSSPMGGYWVDTTLCCEPLLAWYFNSHLGTTGYTYSHFMDWLINSCGYDLHQLPCSDSVVAPCDTLQILLDSFRVQYPDSLGSLIYEFKEVPVHKITHVSESYSGGTYSGENSWFSGASLTATTWTVGGQWQKIRDNLVFDFKVLPRNAAIDSAHLNLYAKPDHIEFFPCCGAHYRNNTQNIFGIFERSLGPVIPGQVLWNNLPGTTTMNSINLPAISVSNGSGSGNDLYSNEDFLNRGMTGLVQDMYSRVLDSNINYGLMFRLNNESLAYKAYTFWGIENYTPTGENPHLMVRYSASRCDVFTAWVNNALGTHLTPQQVASMYNKCGISIDCPQPWDSLLLCGKSEPVFPPVEINDIDNCSDTAFIAASVGQEMYNSYRDSLLGKFDSLYTAKCMDAYKFETFTVTRDKSEFHYTLYYYDQAGNLVKTVPPEGVHPNHDPQWLADVANARDNGQEELANHTLATEYRYNTLNQVVAQSSPDGGLSEFWYDRLGRLVVSQNAKQKAASGTENGRQYSYTVYDYLGRISEVGQITNATTDAMTDVISRDPAALATWIQNSTANREQITRTVYDLAYTGFTGAVLGQRNLRNRVSYTTYSQGNNPAQYNNGSFYTYDAHGNVDTLLQDYGSSLITVTKNVMNANGNRFKKMVYRYDLISGKVNHVAYQPGQADQFYHRYSYDAENRLILVETSQDSAHWEKDARYTYYKHGPLARMILGEQQVQGLDYAYTLQGWIKGVNATSLNPGYDMGQDGQNAASNQYVARDAYSYSLNYFTGDYTSISGLIPFPGSSAYLGNSHRPLYNGNISSMAVNIRQFNAPMLYNCRYDQLNRLTAMDAFNGLNESTNSWAGLTAIDAYKERVSYDGNGNILTYTRNANSSTIMDDLTYRYSYDGNGHLDKNQLLYVDDAVGAGVNADDIDDQSSGNYLYDEIGNLIYDGTEGIDEIEWNVYGKIASITKSGDPNNITSINYTYDAGGNRISKTVTKSTGAVNTTWYVRDASGNVMALYTAEGTDPENPESIALKLTEQHLYGSSRLGILTRDVDMEVAYTPPAVVDFVRGHKFFELSNHLGNVLVTISDKRTGHDAGSGFYDYYDADVVTANDYYPFGMLMPGRKYLAQSSYRYGFNGKENDNEVKGVEGSQQDYGMRIYDPRLGKFLSVDPLTNDYPELTPYQFASNRPIDGIDLDGLEYTKAELIKILAEAKSVLGNLVSESAIVLRGTSDAIVNANSFGVTDNLPSWLSGTNNLNDYDNDYDKSLYLYGRLLGDIAAALQGLSEIGTGGTMASAGGVLASTGGGAIVGGPTAIAGGVVAGHGFAVGAAAAYDIGWVLKKIEGLQDGINNRKQAETPENNTNNQTNSAHGGGAGNNQSNHIFGQNGTQTPSHTTKKLTKDGNERIDVENPNPGQRPGQIHYQRGDVKLLFDPEKKIFLQRSSGGKWDTPISNTENKKLLKNTGVQQGINKALKYLGEPEITF